MTRRVLLVFISWFLLAQNPWFVRGAGTLLAQGQGAGLEVDPGLEAARTFFLTYYQNAATPAIAWFGDRATCEAGATAPAFRDAVQLRINYFRAMAGVPAGITFSATYNDKAQAAALMMSVNSQLSHSPPASGRATPQAVQTAPAIPTSFWECTDGTPSRATSGIPAPTTAPPAIAAAFCTPRRRSWERETSRRSAGGRRTPSG